MTAQPGGNLLSLFWTPIVAVGCSDARGPNAQISVSTFGAGVVPDRPRLLCVLYKSNATHEMALAKRSFSLSVLSAEQVDLIPALGFVSGHDHVKLDGLDFELTQHGNPVFAGSLGWIECEVIETFDFGDSTAFLSAVVENQRLREGQPLIWSRLAHTLPQEWQDTWAAKMSRDIERYRSLMHWLENGGFD